LTNTLISLEVTLIRDQGWINDGARYIRPLESDPYQGFHMCMPLIFLCFALSRTALPPLQTSTSEKHPLTNQKFRCVCCFLNLEIWKGC